MSNNKGRQDNEPVAPDEWHRPDVTRIGAVHPHFLLSKEFARRLPRGSHLGQLAEQAAGDNRFKFPVIRLASPGRRPIQAGGTENDQRA